MNMKNVALENHRFPDTLMDLHNNDVGVLWAVLAPNLGYKQLESLIKMVDKGRCCDDLPSGDIGI